MGKRTERRKNISKQRQRKRVISILIIVIGLSLVAFVIISSLNADNSNTSDIILPPAHDRPAISENTMGDQDAPVIVEEFSNYECGHCLNFAQNLEPQFIEDYVTPGKVFFKYMPYSWTDLSTFANIATFCAMNQGKFWEYRDIVYANMQNQAIGGLNETNLYAYAGVLELNEQIFSDCLTKKSSLHYVDDIVEYAGQVGITGTPTFKVNDRLVYANDLYSTIEEELGKTQ
jgi:protein-disulfide isomerase